MSSDPTTEQKIAKVDELIRDVGTCMLTTVDATTGKLHSRPMHLQGGLDNGKLFFFAYQSSAKMDDVETTHRVNCGFSCPKSQHFVSISGQAKMTTDRAKMEQKWNPMLTAWFADGLDTDGICLIEVDADDTQYWDAPSSTLVHVYGVAKAAITGEPVKDAGENEKVSL